MNEQLFDEETLEEWGETTVRLDELIMVYKAAKDVRERLNRIFGLFTHDVVSYSMQGTVAVVDKFVLLDMINTLDGKQ